MQSRHGSKTTAAETERRRIVHGLNLRPSSGKSYIICLPRAIFEDDEMAAGNSAAALLTQIFPAIAAEQRRLSSFPNDRREGL